MDAAGAVVGILARCEHREERGHAGLLPTGLRSECNEMLGGDGVAACDRAIRILYARGALAESSESPISFLPSPLSGTKTDFLTKKELGATFSECVCPARGFCGGGEIARNPEFVPLAPLKWNKIGLSGDS